jgi:hypothetical protein
MQVADGYPPEWPPVHLLDAQDTIDSRTKCLVSLQASCGILMLQGGLLRVAEVVSQPQD